jgi:hypothetical protein
MNGRAPSWLNAGRNIGNAVLGEGLRRLDLMRESSVGINAGSGITFPVTLPKQRPRGPLMRSCNMHLGLVEDLGFEVLDAGPLAAVRLLEPLAMAWKINPTLRYGTAPDRAWALLNRQH